MEKTVHTYLHIFRFRRLGYLCPFPSKVRPRPREVNKNALWLSVLDRKSCCSCSMKTMLTMSHPLKFKWVYAIALPEGSKPGHFLVPHSLLSRPSPSQGLPPATGGEHERTLVAEPPPQELLQLLQADHGDHEPSTERSMNDLLLEQAIDQQVDPTWAFPNLTVLTFYALS